MRRLNRLISKFKESLVQEESVEDNEGLKAAEGTSGPRGNAQLIFNI